MKNYLFLRIPLLKPDGFLTRTQHSIRFIYTHGMLWLLLAMLALGIRGIAPGPDTSQPHPEHKVYPYLLRGVAIDRVNHVWSTDITYIPLPYVPGSRIGWYSRYVLSWQLSNTLDTAFCLEALEQALQVNTPDIFNTDQGVQFTSGAFTGA